MTDPVVPDGLSAALRSAGMVLAGPAGSGSGGPRWTARSPDGTRWGVTLVAARSPGHVEHLEERGARLALLDHEALATCLPPLRLAARRVVALHALVAGTDLATVHAARPGWAPAEVVGVLAPLARALAVLHRAGLAHGDVSPANVVLAADGRPVLVDLLCGDDLLQQGTPGVAAPERPRGARPAGDVHALARTGLLLLGDTADRDGEAAVRGVLEDAACPDPDRRPSAEDLAAALVRSCPPASALLPDAAVLARLALQRLADVRDDETTRPGTRRRPPRARHRGTRDRRGVVVGGALTAGGLAVALVVAGAVLPGASWSATTGDGGGVGVAPLHLDPAAAAVRLTAGRAEALTAQDAAALASVTVPGSPAARTDADLLRSLAEAGQAGSDLSLDIGSVRRIADAGEAPGAAGPDPGSGLPGPLGDAPLCPGVRIEASLRPTAATGGTTARGSATTTTAVVLRVCPTSTGWRVSEVESA
jgi:hypothetical protein